jgi:hypothetical protein
MIPEILFAAWLALLPAQEPVKIPGGARALVEAGEPSANAAPAWAATHFTWPGWAGMSPGSTSHPRDWRSCARTPKKQV